MFKVLKVMVASTSLKTMILVCFLYKNNLKIHSKQSFEVFRILKLTCVTEVLFSDVIGLRLMVL
jgi:hypothetical protein